MKTFKTAFLALIALCAVGAAATADARGRFHHHGARVGVFIGAPLFPYYYPYPRYYYPPAYYPPAYYPPAYYPPAYYYPPTVVAPASPPVYIEQNPPLASAAPASPTSPGAGAYWFYCRDTQTYYPYVQQCASPWERVVPQPNPSPQSAAPAPGSQAGPADAGTDEPDLTPRT